MFKNPIKPFSLVGGWLIALAFASAASAAPLLDTWTSLTVADSTQLGRMNRIAPSSDWSSNKVFQGIINTGTSYHYRMFTVPAALIGSMRYIQVSYDDTNLAVFVSAYDGSYTPPTSSTKYLGDAGSSGNFFGNMGFFQVLVPAGDDLAVVVNEVNSSGGIGKPFRLLVEGFVDTQYNDTFAPRFVSIKTYGTNLVLNGANGFAGKSYRVLTSTNMTLPLSSWTVISSNVLGRNGNFNFTLTNEVTPAKKQGFYDIQALVSP